MLLRLTPLLKTAQQIDLKLEVVACKYRRGTAHAYLINELHLAMNSDDRQR